MKKHLILLTISITAGLSSFSQTPMAVPTTLSGANISLTLQEGTTTFYTGITTNTMGANGSLLGPTLVLDKGANVSLTVDNQLTDTTTIHWHGMHVAPENDGGPHSIILPGNSWNPQFDVMDKAGIYWYHPHLHMRTGEHVSKGIAGLIIVHDAEEAALNLPMTYGVDDFPIVMQTKGFDASGQIEWHTEMDTSVMVNGTIDATLDLPAQVVRLRVLNGASQRVMEFGFSDDRFFDIIGTDGGLLTAPVNLNRYRLAPGQRADILIDLGTSLGDNFQLMSYGSELPNAIYGATQPGMGPGATIPGYTSNPLNGSDFQLIDITVAAATTTPITTIPATLAVFTPIPEASATTNRDLLFTSAGGMGNIVGPFLINGSSFDMSVINYYIPEDNIEIWTLTNQTPIGHPFHIHDVQFFILDINGATPPPELQGLNDVVFVPGGNGVVRFIAQFSDFVNDTIPFMYHCHMLTHEDMGMMGQFLVTNQVQGIQDNNTSIDEISVYPNPSENGLFTIRFSDLDQRPNSFEIRSIDGKLILENEISPDASIIELSLEGYTGMYLITFYTNDRNLTKKIILK